jgi:hypothetical protein
MGTRSWSKGDAVDGVVLAAVDDLFSGPEPAQQVEPFVEHRGSHLRVDRLAELAELRRRASEPSAEGDTTAAQVVERRDLVRDDLGPAARDGRDRRAEPHAGRRRGDRGQDGPGIGRR